MTKNVLVVDDDVVLMTSLAMGLKSAGFNVITAKSAKEADEILSRILVDAIVLDRMMDGMDGLTFLKTLRLKGNATPVIMLTALSGPENTIDGLEGGADDYMAKPFQLRELVLRLKNVTKKQEKSNGKTEKSNGLFFVDGEFFVKTKDNQNVLLMLSVEEKKLLQNLMNPMGNIVPATPMVAKRLRNKIKGVLSDADIVTVRGMGYKLIVNKG